MDVRDIASLVSLALLDKVLIVHAPLNDQQGGCDERLLEELTLKHLDKVLDPDVLLALGRGRLVPPKALPVWAPTSTLFMR